MDPALTASASRPMPLVASKRWLKRSFTMVWSSGKPWSSFKASSTVSLATCCTQARVAAV